MKLLLITGLMISVQVSSLKSQVSGTNNLQPIRVVRPVTCDLKPLGSGVYLVIVEGDTLIARDKPAERDVQKMFEDYRLTKATLEDTKKLLQDTEALVQRYRDELKLKDTIIAKNDSLAQAYKKLYEKAKRLSREPSLRFEGGLGLSDGSVAVLGGIGIRRVNFWTTIRKDITSYFIGANLPVRIPLID